MAELLDFMVVRSDRSEAVAKYTVLYRPADYFCKRLNFEFDNSEEAEAVAFYFQYWMNAGGRVRYTGSVDVHGRFGHDGLSHGPIQTVVLSVQLRRILPVTTGRIPAQSSTEMSRLSVYTTCHIVQGGWKNQTGALE